MAEFTIGIPEEFIVSKIDEVASKKLAYVKLKDICTKVSADLLKVESVQIKQYLYDKIYSDLEKDITAHKDLIIEAFLERSKTMIYLNAELKATVSQGAHKELSKLISYLQLFKQALIVGPTGSGKSTMAKQAADAMNLPFGSFSCNMEASKSELIGFQNLNGYVESSFLHFFENGGVFLVDEYDAMSPSISVVLNAAFDRSGQISVPNRSGKTVAVKHPDFYCILAGNTWGSGSTDYSGRDMQDAAFLDRFKMCRLHIDYDQDLEKQIAGEHYNFLMKIRSFVNENLDGEKFSTRSIYDASVLLQNGFTKKQIMESVSSHWDETIREKFYKTVK